MAADDYEIEASEKVAIVPNQFFDLFARVIPGAVLLFILKSLAGLDLLNVVSGVFIPYSLADQVVPWLIIVVACTYALGHALSPLTKLLERAGALWRTRPTYSSAHPEPNLLFENEVERYNHLRFKYPARVIYATRIRAESTMYGGIAAAIAVGEAASVGVWLTGAQVPSMLWHVISLLLLCGMIARYFDVHKRFCKTISAFESAAKKNSEPQSSKPNRH